MMLVAVTLIPPHRLTKKLLLTLQVVPRKSKSAGVYKGQKITDTTFVCIEE
jgi:hypothetical protein